MLDLIDFACSLKDMRSANRQWQALISLAATKGFDKTIYGFVPLGNPSKQFHSGVIWLRDCPEEWSKRYAERNYAPHDPIVAHCKKSRSTFDWKTMEENCNNGLYGTETRELCLDAQSLGMVHGVTFPLRDTIGSKGGISFSARADIGEREYRRELVRHYDTLQDHADVFHVTFNRRPASTQHFRLTDRELECLKWIVEGLLHKGIAKKMGVSVSAVDQYVRAIKKKLNVTTTAQTVAMAISANLLDS